MKYYFNVLIFKIHLLGIRNFQTQHIIVAVMSFETQMLILYTHKDSASGLSRLLLSSHHTKDINTAIASSSVYKALLG